MPEIIVKLGENVVHKYYFDKDVISIGRARDNDIVIENLAVSRNHARIRRENAHFVLTDLNSANGTYVNGVRVTKTEVMNDDVVTVGKHYLHFVNKDMSDEQIISDAFGAERTMIVEKVANASLTIAKGKQQGEQFNITKYETFVGRASDNDIRLHDWFVSKKHAVIVRQGHKFFIRDLGSWRGTMVNGKQIKDTELKDGDMLAFGTTQLEFKMQSDEVALLEGRKPVEMLGEDVPEVPQEPMVAAAVSSNGPPHDLSASFVQMITHPDEAIAGAAPSHADPPVEEFFLQSDGEDEAPIPSFTEGGQQPQDVIFVEEDEKQPFEESSDNLVLEPYEEPPRKAVNTDDQESIEFADAAGEAQPFDRDKFETAVESLDEQPVPAFHEPAPSRQQTPHPAEDSGRVIARQDEYELPAGLPAGVDEKLVKMWLRAMSNKSKVVRKQAAKELKKLTGITYEWE